MLKQQILAKAIALVLVITPLIANAEDFCIGNFFEQGEEVPNVIPPTVKMITHQLLQLKAGESLVISLEQTTDSGDASFLSCVDKGQLSTEDDFNQIKYTAPPYIPETEVIQWGVQISDNLGYVGGDSLLLRLVASGAGNPYIIVSTQDKILIYSSTGDLENDITAIAEQLATIDSDNDGLDEIAADDGSNIALYEFNGDDSEPLSLDNVFVVKADINRDGIEETITGSQTANEVSVDGVPFIVFEGTGSSTRRARKANKDNGNSGNNSQKDDDKETGKDKEQITICHKGQQTKTLPESAISAHLGHGDTLGACGSEAIEDKKVTVCHVPEDNPDNRHEITISVNALEDHLSHGDTEGSCNDNGMDNGTIYRVNVAAGDLNGDGGASIVVAMAQNGSLVEIYSGDGQLHNSFNAFESNNGVLVAVGDITGDGQAEIITAEPNGTEIRIFDANGIKTGGFPVSDNIVSLAVGISIIETSQDPLPEENQVDSTEEIVSDETSTESDSNDSIAETSIDETPTSITDNNETVVPIEEPASTDETPASTTENNQAVDLTTEDADADETPVSITEVNEVDLPSTTETVLPTVTSSEELIEENKPSETLVDIQPLVETTTNDSIAVSPELPTTGEIIGVHDYKGRTITNAIIRGHIANTRLAGDIINEGILSNFTVLEGATLQGGILTGSVENYGIIADIEFVGYVLEGGYLSGTITINSDTKFGLGLVANVTLLPETTIIGGMIMEVVVGNAEAPALIEAAKILGGAELYDVIIGQDCWIDPNVTLGEGVRFTDNAIIPEDVDLTEALSTEDGIDINTDVVTDGPSLLNQINDLPDMQANDWELVQNQESGKLDVMVDGTHLVTIEILAINQAKRHRKAKINIHGDGTVTVITVKGREILVEIQ